MEKKKVKVDEALATDPRELEIVRQATLVGSHYKNADTVEKKLDLLASLIILNISLDLNSPDYKRRLIHTAKNIAEL